MERLGEVTVPSGTLTIVDPGLIGMYLAEEIVHVPVVSIAGLPTNRTLAVVAERVARGRWRECWEYVAVEIAELPIASSEEVGLAMVDFARLLIADSSSAGKWVQEDAIDGKADFVFWGRDAAALATALGAPAMGDGDGDGNYGWSDLDVDTAVAYGTRAEELKKARGWKLATDFRPHSHHWQALERVRESATESGTIEVEDLRVCLFMTTWGDGLFPVLVERAVDGRLVRVRIQLHTVDSEDAMAGVNAD